MNTLYSCGLCALVCVCGVCLFSAAGTFVSQSDLPFRSYVCALLLCFSPPAVSLENARMQRGRNHGEKVNGGWMCGGSVQGVCFNCLHVGGHRYKVLDCSLPSDVGDVNEDIWGHKKLSKHSNGTSETDTLQHTHAFVWQRGVLLRLKLFIVKRC